MPSAAAANPAQIESLRGPAAHGAHGAQRRGSDETSHEPAGPASTGLPHLRAVPNPDHYLDRTAFDSSTDADVPPPEVVTIQKLALYAFEVLEGSRSIAQLGGWITREVAAALLMRRAVRTERRTLYHDARRIVACPGPAHIDRPLPHIVEAVVVLYAEPRSHSVALRLEHRGDRWRATELTVL